MSESGFSKAMACNSVGEMSTWPSWSYRISLHRFVWDYEDKRLFVVALIVEQGLLKLQSNPVVAHRALE